MLLELSVTQHGAVGAGGSAKNLEEPKAGDGHLGFQGSSATNFPCNLAKVTSAL